MTGFAFRLLVIHRRLDDEIRTALARRWPDVAKVQRLKKLKLAVKDRLHQLSLGISRTPRFA